MALSLIRINYKTNFNQYPMTYNSDASTFKINNTISRRINNYNKQLPKDTYLFTDIFPLNDKDYPKNDIDFVLLLKSPRDFWNIIQKRKKKYKDENNKEYKITQRKIKQLKYKEHNLKYIVERLFKIGTKIYLPGRDKYRPVTITNYRYIPFNMSFGESKEKILKHDINVITCLLDLELSEEYKGSVGMSELKKMDCNNKSKRISEIWNNLHDKESKGFKKIDIKRNTPGMYRVRGGNKYNVRRTRKKYISKCERKAIKHYNYCKTKKRNCWNKARRKYKHCRSRKKNSRK
ncbi:hypothetical protein OAA43_00600 [bacterium]|nr:hypothetical protein [bacterium]